MATWTTPDWSSHNPEIDDEHKKLHQMVSSLAAVISNDGGRSLSSEALNILRDRLKLHFGLEEQTAARIDAEASRILHEDHAHLLGLLELVKSGMAGQHPAEVKARMAAFMAALDKHDAEIDVPLFRMMAALKAKDPLPT
jgi:hemerythrin